jgi:hypothetical protein
MKTSKIITLCYLREQSIGPLRRRPRCLPSCPELPRANGTHDFHPRNFTPSGPEGLETEHGSHHPLYRALVQCANRRRVRYIRRHCVGSQYGLPDLWHSELRGTEDRDAELAFLDLRRSLNPTLSEGRIIETLDPQHRPHALFHSPVVQRDHVIQVAVRPYKEFCGHATVFREASMANCSPQRKGDRRHGLLCGTLFPLGSPGHQEGTHGLARTLQISGTARDR